MTMSIVSEPMEEDWFNYEYCKVDNTKYVNKLVREGWELVEASRIQYGETSWTVLMRKRIK